MWTLCVPFSPLLIVISIQATTAKGVPRYDLVKTRHGKKYFARAVKEQKDQSWMAVAASLVIQVIIWNKINCEIKQILMQFCSSVLRQAPGPIWLFLYWMKSRLSDLPLRRSANLTPFRPIRPDLTSSCPLFC